MVSAGKHHMSATVDAEHGHRRNIALGGAENLAMTSVPFTCNMRVPSATKPEAGAWRPALTVTGAQQQHSILCTHGHRSRPGRTRHTRRRGFRTRRATRGCRAGCTPVRQFEVLRKAHVVYCGWQARVAINVVAAYIEDIHNYDKNKLNLRGVQTKLKLSTVRIYQFRLLRQAITIIVINTP
ncbi:unnamed protein product [Amoebophrya sp. A120]|nr:unnamed protein product [Amoebophrya sp. A120]|eukprot:GSA120T00001787001.1